MKSIILKTLVMAMAAMTFAACSSDPTEDGTKDQQETTAPKTDEQTADETVTVPNVQSATTTVSLEDIQKKGLGGIKVQFSMTGITKLELESVDNYQIAGTLGGEKQTIITYNAPMAEHSKPARNTTSSHSPATSVAATVCPYIKATMWRATSGYTRR